MSTVAAILAIATNHTDGGWRRVLAGASAVLVALVAVISRSKTGQGSLREWIRARSASEGLKTEAYQYVTRTGPYASARPAETLSKRTEDIANAARDLNHLVAGVTAKASEPLPDPMPIDAYLERRVDSQITRFYAPKAASEAKLVRRYQNAELVLAAAGAVLAGAATVVEESTLAPWTAAITTAIAGLVAHLAAGRHEYQVTTYTATRLKLQQLGSRFRDEPANVQQDPARINQLVTECEQVISVENQGWMAEWEKPKS